MGQKEVSYQLVLDMLSYLAVIMDMKVKHVE